LHLVVIARGGCGVIIVIGDVEEKWGVGLRGASGQGIGCGARPAGQTAENCPLPAVLVL